MKRCEWVGDDPLYIEYHDREWGVPVHDDKIHFEFLILEGAQAGLSWLTILKRRDGYKRVFHGFDPNKVSVMTDADIEDALNDEGIIRNRLKVQSAVKNARAFLQIQEEFGSFDDYIWSFVDGQPIINRWKELSQIPASTDTSERISKDLKRRHMSFVGPTIMYAHMQATGLVNDHQMDCFRWRQLQP